MSNSPNKAQRYIYVAPAVEDRQDRVAPCSSFREQVFGGCASIGLAYLRPDRKLVKRSEMAFKLTAQKFVAIAALLHEQEPYPFPF